MKVDLRIIAATNRNLLDMVEKGTFREDLYYRLNVFPMTIPPLRERASDVILLADHFVAVYANETGKDVKRISTPALNMLMAYHWPGNVRELENVIERSVILSEDGVIHGYNLPPSLQTSTETGTTFGCGLEAKLQAVEYEMIVEALKTHGGNMTEAAKDLGLTRRILGLRMEKHAITYKAFRKKRGRQVSEQPEPRLSANQRYHLMLADIAMAAAIKTLDPAYAIAGGESSRARRRARRLARPMRRRGLEEARKRDGVGGHQLVEGAPRRETRGGRRDLRRRAGRRRQRAPGGPLRGQAQRRAQL